MEAVSGKGDTDPTASRQLADLLRICRNLSGELHGPDLQAAIERAALELTGAVRARVVLDGEPPSPPGGSLRTAAGVSRSVPIHHGSESVGTLELEGLPGSLSAETLFTLELLSCQAGIALASARALAEHAAERTARLSAEDLLRTALVEAQAEVDLFDGAPVGLHSLDGEGRFLRINATELAWLGYTREEVVGRLRMPDIATPASRATFEGAFSRFKAEGVIRDYELELVRKDGSLLHVLVTATAVYRPDGEFAYTRSILIDQTQRRQSEAALRERDRFIRRVTDATPDLVYVFDLALGRNVYMNRQTRQVLGYSPDEVDSMGPELFATLLHPDDLALLEERLRKLETARDDEVVEIEYRMKDARGDWRWLLSRDVVFARGADGRTTQVMGVARDITARKTAQAILAKSESFYRTLVETIPGGVLNFDEDGRITWTSPTALALVRASPDALSAGLRLPDFVAPEFRSLAAERRRRLLVEGKAAEPAEIRFVRRDGSSFWGLVSSAPFLEKDGRVSGGVTVVLDASEKHRAEEELGHREKFIEKVLRATPDAMYVFGLDDRRIVFANRGLASLAGYSSEEAEALEENLLPTLLHPEDLALYEERVARYEEASDEDVLETYFRVKHKDGSWRCLYGRGVVFERSPNGRPAQVLAVVKDVTAQKQVEDALRESESFHRALTDTVPVGIVVTDEKSRITWTSPAFRTLIGVSSENAVAGSPVSDWVFPGFEELVLENRRTPRPPDPQVQPREIRLRRRDGSDLWADLVSAPLFRSDGVFSGAIVAVQDATARRHASKTLKKAAERLQHLSCRVVEVQEEERRHLARELHDEIGQALAAIFFRMQALLRSPDPFPRQLVEDSAEIADRTMRTVRDLSLDLHPSLLDEAGLADTLRWYIDRQVRGPGLEVELAVCPATVALPGELRSACFRIAQSALTNVVRHARARSVRVEIGARDGVLELVVHDDGMGFNLATTLPRATSGTSLGILGMQERAELLGGSITFESAPGRGTTVRARLPLPLPDLEEAAS
ncbi:MAG: PAS domain S-box protein [Deltaproteobacteria bacterium]|nr:PAS domain S-box protein [Deltaproteobacteria bacterium]